MQEKQFRPMEVGAWDWGLSYNMVKVKYSIRICCHLDYVICRMASFISFRALAFKLQVSPVVNSKINPVGGK